MTNKIKELQLKWKEDVQSPAHAQTTPKHMFQEHFYTTYPSPTIPQPHYPCITAPIAYDIDKRCYSRQIEETNEQTQ